MNELQTKGLIKNRLKKDRKIGKSNELKQSVFDRSLKQLLLGPRLPSYK